MHSVGGHDQRGAAWLSVDNYPYDASIFTQRAIHLRSRVSDDSRRVSRRAEQYLIQVLPSLAVARDWKASCLRKSPRSKSSTCKPRRPSRIARVEPATPAPEIRTSATVLSEIGVAWPARLLFDSSRPNFRRAVHFSQK